MYQLEVKDIQGIIVRGYANLPQADFLVLSIDPQNATKARKFLAAHVSAVTPGNLDPAETALNMAFTFHGLRMLGVDESAMSSFPMEFEDGMTSPHKQQLLGDTGKSDPAHWRWGGTAGKRVDVLLMLYANDDNTLASFSDQMLAEAQSHGLDLIQQLHSTPLPEQKVHFGFHDGISQPTIEGLDRRDVPANTIAAGEFILGYPNEYDQYSGLQIGDLAKNGSYLVFRQIEQNVDLFWKTMASLTHTSQEMIALASKMFGRWPGGAPLVLSPAQDDETMAYANDFTYRTQDPDGLKCPFSAHIRRTNPRDSVDTSKAKAVQITKRHRILRRGRPYGNPSTLSMKREDMLIDNHSGERGLYFICINADISRQFEFIQSVWVNDPKLNGRFDERDPIVGNDSGSMSVQQEGLRIRYAALPNFVTIIGGAYFFLPGIRALLSLTKTNMKS